MNELNKHTEGIFKHLGGVDKVLSLNDVDVNCYVTDVYIHVHPQLKGKCELFRVDCDNSWKGCYIVQGYKRTRAGNLKIVTHKTGIKGSNLKDYFYDITGYKL